MKSLPWYKRDVDAWRGGTRGMSMELRGFYSECLDAIWDLQGPLPKDEAKLAVMMATNPRTVRKLLPQLIGLGKLIETDTGYHNPRMMRDLPAAKSATSGEPIRAELEPNSARIPREFEPKVAKTQAKSMAVLTEVRGKREEEDKNPPRPPQGGAPLRSNSRRPRRRERADAFDAALAKWNSEDRPCAPN